MYDFSQQANDYKKIEKAICFIEDKFLSQPNLDEIASHVHLSKYHFNRLFKRWAGIGPVQFLQFVTLDHTKKKLAKSKSTKKKSKGRIDTSELMSENIFRDGFFLLISTIYLYSHIWKIFTIMDELEIPGADRALH